MLLNTAQECVDASECFFTTIFFLSQRVLQLLSGIFQISLLHLEGGQFFADARILRPEAVDLLQKSVNVGFKLFQKFHKS